jgi:hypothetical protein
LHAALLGDADAAFQWFDIAIERRDTLMPFVHIYTASFVPDLTRDPRFEKILKRMNLPR